ncbi:serine hydrolase [Actinomadura scrupuli]|uniref:serine hydrolase n=1 Tax=Actinomadura scrupuli TaxID=559629 RepID=UPI003D967560
MRHVSAIGLALLLTVTGCRAGQESSAAEDREIDQVVSAIEAQRDHRTLSRARAHRATLRRLNAFHRSMAAYLATRPGRASVLVEDLRTGATFGYDPHSRYITASVMKVNILTGLLLQRQDARQGLSEAERVLAAKMIRYSDNKAANALYRAAGGALGIGLVDQRLGLPHTVPHPESWGATSTCPADQVRLLHALTDPGSPLGAPERRYVLGLMSSVTPGQRWGVSAAALPGDHVATKNGWVPTHRRGVGWAVNSVGRITGHGHDFLVAVFTAGDPHMRSGVETAEHVATLAVAALRGRGPVPANPGRAPHVQGTLVLRP